MRQFKFRGKDLSGDWRYGYLLQKDVDTDAYFIREINPNNIPPRYTDYQVKQVGQFVLTINGIDYYEGMTFELTLVGVETHIEIQNGQLEYNQAVGGFGFYISEQSSKYFGWIGINDKNILGRKLFDGLMRDTKYSELMDDLAVIKEGVKELNKSKDELLTSEEVMALLKISRTSYNRLKDEGVIPVYLLRGKLYCKRSEIMKVLDSGLYQPKSSLKMKEGVGESDLV